MEPPVQYCTTSDGVSIAFSTLGEGHPLVMVPDAPWSFLIATWPMMPMAHRWLEALAEGRMLVCYDGRGSGLSERDVREFSLETMLLDVEAVVHHLGLRSYDLFGATTGGQVAIASAVRHPGSVSHLVTWLCAPRSLDWMAAPQGQALLAMGEQEWELLTETAARFALGWAQEEAARGLAAGMRSAVTPATFTAMYEAIRQFDVTSMLPEVRAPTLVMHRRDFRWQSVDIARHLAAAVPSARMVVVTGSVGAPFAEDPDENVAIIDEFLSDGRRAGARIRRAAHGPLTVLFTDLVHHTEMMSRLGDARGREMLREHERITRETLKHHHGAEVKSMGDGFMASFASVTSAMDCAVALQRAFAARNASAGEPLAIRVGLNAGEPIEEEGDLFGASVIMASRVCACAGPGEILIPEPVRHLLAGKDFVYADRGEFLPKGFEDAVRLFEVRWRK